MIDYTRHVADFLKCLCIILRDSSLMTHTQALECTPKNVLSLFIVLLVCVIQYSKTPLLRPPIDLRKNGLYIGVVLLLS